MKEQKWKQHRKQLDEAVFYTFGRGVYLLLLVCLRREEIFIQNMDKPGHNGYLVTLGELQPLQGTGERGFGVQHKVRLCNIAVSAWE